MRIILVSLLSLCLIATACPAQSGVRRSSPAPITPEATAPVDASSTIDPLDGCQVIARIGKQIVLSCEVMWQVNLLIEERGVSIPADQLDEARMHLMRQNLNGKLDLKLLYADFRSRVPQADLAAIHKNLNKAFEEDELPRLMKQIGVERSEDVEERLNELGGSLEDVRQEFYQAMIGRSWAREAVKSKVDEVVTHAQLLEYYRENGGRYDYPAQARWEELMVQFEKFDSRNEAWAAICNMGNQALPLAAQSGSSAGGTIVNPVFADIAKAKSHGFTASDGGAHDWTTKGALAADTINEALDTLRVGEMSPVLQSNLGFHIVRVLERKLAGRKPFEEVQQEIQSRLLAKRFDRAIQEKVSDLRRTTQIWTIYGGTMTAQAFRDSLRRGPVRR